MNAFELDLKRDSGFNKPFKAFCDSVEKHLENNPEISKNRFTIEADLSMLFSIFDNLKNTNYTDENKYDEASHGINFWIRFNYSNDKCRTSARCCMKYINNTYILDTIKTEDLLKNNYNMKSDKDYHLDEVFTNLENHKNNFIIPVMNEFKKMITGFREYYYVVPPKYINKFTLIYNTDIQQMCYSIRTGGLFNDNMPYFLPLDFIVELDDDSLITLKNIVNAESQLNYLSKLRTIQDVDLNSIIGDIADELTKNDTESELNIDNKINALSKIHNTLIDISKLSIIQVVNNFVSKFKSNDKFQFINRVHFDFDSFNYIAIECKNSYVINIYTNFTNHTHDINIKNIKIDNSQTKLSTSTLNNLVSEIPMDDIVKFYGDIYKCYSSVYGFVSKDQFIKWLSKYNYSDIFTIPPKLVVTTEK